MTCLLLRIVHAVPRWLPTPTSTPSAGHMSGLRLCRLHIKGLLVVCTILLLAVPTNTCLQHQQADACCAEAWGARVDGAGL